MKIAIVEDEAAAAKNLENYLKRYESEHSLSFQIKWYRDGLDFLENYRAEFDIVFMDIKMPLSNGMDIATKLRRIDDDVCLIFVTNMGQYAIKGYEVGAMYFLLKPVSYFDFAFKFEKAICEREKRLNCFITLNTREGIRRVSVQDILYIEVIRHLLIYHTKTMNYEVWNETLMKVEEKMKGFKNFARASASFLVNLDYVKSVEGSNIRIGDDIIPLSRSRRKEFLNALTLFTWGNSNE